MTSHSNEQQIIFFKCSCGFAWPVHDSIGIKHKSNCVCGLAGTQILEKEYKRINKQNGKRAVEIMKSKQKSIIFPNTVK